MQFVVKFNCDNAAFGDSDDDLRCAIADTLRDVANHVESCATVGEAFPVCDVNGNMIGAAAWHGGR